LRPSIFFLVLAAVYCAEANWREALTAKKETLAPSHPRSFVERARKEHHRVGDGSGSGSGSGSVVVADSSTVSEIVVPAVASLSNFKDFCSSDKLPPTSAPADVTKFCLGFQQDVASSACSGYNSAKMSAAILALSTHLKTGVDEAMELLTCYQKASADVVGMMADCFDKNQVNCEIIEQTTFDEKIKACVDKTFLSKWLPLKRHTLDTINDVFKNLDAISDATACTGTRTSKFPLAEGQLSQCQSTKAYVTGNHWLVHPDLYVL